MPPGLIDITVVIPTLNEADRLQACLASVTWAREIIVVDGGSTDETVAIARAYGARVLEGTWPTISAQRNAAIAVATTPWVFAIDADERASAELPQGIAEVLGDGGYDAYRIAFHNSYLGHTMTRGSWARDQHVRLFRKHLRFHERRAHESLAFDGPVGEVRGVIVHVTYRDLAHQMEKSDRYGRWGAMDLYAKGHRTSLVRDLIGRTLWRFFKYYVVQGMWREGRLGLVFSAVHAWSGFTKYAHLWYLEHSAVPRPQPSVPVVNVRRFEEARAEPADVMSAAAM